MSIDKIAKETSLIDKYRLSMKLATKVSKSNNRMRFYFKDGSSYDVRYDCEIMRVEEDLFNGEVAYFF